MKKIKSGIIAHLAALAIAVLLPLAPAAALAAEGAADESWVVEESGGRIFYYTHGTVVWGHENEGK